MRDLIEDTEGGKQGRRSFFQDMAGGLVGLWVGIRGFGEVVKRDDQDMKALNDQFQEVVNQEAEYSRRFGGMASCCTMSMR